MSAAQWTAVALLAAALALATWRGALRRVSRSLVGVLRGLRPTDPPDPLGSRAHAYRRAHGRTAFRRRRRGLAGAPQRRVLDDLMAHRSRRVALGRWLARHPHQRRSVALESWRAALEAIERAFPEP